MIPLLNIEGTISQTQGVSTRIIASWLFDQSAPELIRRA
jgi:hypothetical protein